jgi:antitoxin component YwqK of YwqJK toxin-antitoxin module
MFQKLLTCLLLSGALAVQGQNLLDGEGRKTGHWKVEYPNGKILYEAEFVEDKPVGEMVRYYENGAVKARMIFQPGSDRSLARLFFNNGKPAAEGWYVAQIKDSVWTYYSEFDGSVRIREPYLEGMLEGVARSYYPDGKISEEVAWKQNMKEGPWNQYYQNGIRRLSGHYKNGLLNGSYEVYFSNNSIEIRGTYLDNKSHGTWYYYNESGEEIYSLEYLNGTPVDLEKYDLWIQDSLKKYEDVIIPDSFQQP